MADLIEYYNVSDDDAYYLFDNYWKAQTFTLGTTGVNQNYIITSVKIKVLRVGLPGNVNVSIRAASEDLPTGPDLSTGSFDGNNLTDIFPPDWVTVDMTPYILQASTQYALVVSAPDGYTANFLDWTADSSDSTYDGGRVGRSSDSGESWSFYIGDFMFEIYGNPIGKGFADIINVSAPQQAYKDQVIEISANIINYGFDDNLFVKLIANGSEFRQTNYTPTGATWISSFDLIMPNTDLNVEIQVGHEE